MSTTLTIHEKLMTVHGTIGICLFPENGTRLEELISRADLALYSAKQCGKNRYAFYEEGFKDEVHK